MSQNDDGRDNIYSIGPNNPQYYSATYFFIWATKCHTIQRGINVDSNGFSHNKATEMA